MRHAYSRNAIRVTRMLLLIDDDDDFRESLAEFLIFRGYIVQTAEKRRCSDPFVQSAWPGTDSSGSHHAGARRMGFLRERRKDPRLARIPVIVISGSFGVDHRAREAGASEVIKKPFDPKVLLPVIDQFLATS
jgi:CheY-like chemotaxis protein